MRDIIQLLPDVVANQIAAGEVIQRPASALKELMENAIDAGGKLITIVIREAGKSLIQVIDNGCGMSETDARMSFERYATSKLRKADDLFSIRTMGFRGEALASIAAIAHVELKTKRPDDETGIQLVVEGAEFLSSQPVACHSGTSIAVKNLFYNVPARRNFLKSNAAEFRHLLEEFQRVALANPAVEFIMHHNETEIFNLKAGNFRQRITNIFGNAYNERLVPVEEETNLINIRGFVGKPEYAKKIRGEQYFFVNQRYIKNPYLHHAINDAFDDLLKANAFPSYFLFLDIDPSKIDVNVHPTKTEIKFEDDQSIYAILRASVKRALGKFSIAPTLDFEQETAFNLPLSQSSQIPVPPQIKTDPSFNPFKSDVELRFPSPLKQVSSHNSNKGQDWSTLYQGLEHVKFTAPSKGQEKLAMAETEMDSPAEFTCFQLERKYLVFPQQNKLLLVDQQAAHERVLYEKNLEAIKNQPVTSQHLVFPQTIELNHREFSLLVEMKDELKAIGFDMNEFGKQTFVIHGIPPLTNVGEIKQILEELAGQFLYHETNIKLSKSENIARAAAMRMAVRPGRKLALPEMKKLLTDLFACSQPSSSPSGKQVIYSMDLNEIEKKFSN